VIHSIFARITGYFVIFGFVAFIVGPTISWLRGRGFMVDNSYGVELIAVSGVIIWTEAKRFRRVRRNRF
jgi:hypothetical protein